MKHLLELREAKGSKILELWSAKLAECERVQCETLLDILTAAADTEFGRKYGFADIADAEMFRSNVPITHWEDYDEDVDRMKKGVPDILFPGKAACFVVTSGTTGREKLIPESTMGKCAKDVVGDIRNARLIKAFPDVLKGKFLSLANSSSIGRTKGGIPFGMASGMTLDGTPAALLALSACPQPAKEIPDQNLADYAVMRFAVEQDVRAVTGNNPARLQTLLETAENQFDAIVADIERGTLAGIETIPAETVEKLKERLTPNPARAAELRDLLKSGCRPLPSLYWPNLRLFKCWLSGSIGRYLDELRPLLDENVVYVDGGYGASEGKFNIPGPDGKPSGPLANFALFYEFIPEDGGVPRGDEQPLMAHELEDGKLYRLIITTASGLYRYDMRDLVRVDGFTGTTPNIEFVSKTSDIGNICGEKLYPEIISKAFSAVSDETGTRIVHYCVIPDTETKSYIFCVEPENRLESAELENLRLQLDAKLAEFAMGYDFLRGQKLLKAPRCLAMRSGWRDHLLKTRLKPGISSSQIKLPVVCSAKSAEIAEYAVR